MTCEVNVRVEGKTKIKFYWIQCIQRKGPRRPPTKMIKMKMLVKMTICWKTPPLHLLKNHKDAYCLILNKLTFLFQGEDKQYNPPGDLTGALIVLEHCVQQSYFHGLAKEILSTFISRLVIFYFFGLGFSCLDVTR